MTPELSGLLQACREDPSDDTPRLILADWLVEQDEEARAEFIRLQIVRSQLRVDEHARRGTRPDRERRLLAHNRHRWLGPLYPWPDEKQFSRGLVDVSSRFLAWKTYISESSFFKNNGWEGWDWVQRLELTGSQSGLSGNLFDTRLQLPPQLKRLAIKTIELDPKVASILAAMPELEQLNSLELRYNKLGPKAAIPLVKSPHLSRVLQLGIPGNLIGHEGAQALMEARFLSQVTHLDLSWNKLGLADVEGILASSALSGLKNLNLTGNILGRNAGSVLAQKYYLSRFQSLCLDMTGLQGQGISDLLESSYLNQVRMLDLSQNEPDQASIHAIAYTPHLKNLVDLRLRSSGLRLSSYKTLAQGPALSRLNSLDLVDNSLDTESALILVASDTLPQGMRLSITLDDLAPDVIEMLRQRFSLVLFES